MKAIWPKGDINSQSLAWFCANADYSYRLQKDLPGAKSIMHLHPVTTTARIPSVPFVRHILPYVAGTYVTENRSRCLHFDVPIRGIRIAI